MNAHTQPIFPGMDPYLEAADIWPDFHHALASRIRALLNDMNKSTDRQDRWSDCTIFPISVRDQLPCVPVPLGEKESAVALDLQVAARQAYIEGPYRRMLDYSAPPVPPLREEDREWARAMIEAAVGTSHRN